MRFDGRLGFPGGFVDYDDKSLEDALYRELSEEMGLLPKKFEILTSDYLFTHRFEEKKYCLHFYGKEVTPNEYLQIEKRDGVQNYDGFEVCVHDIRKIMLFQFVRSMNDADGVWCVPSVIILLLNVLEL